MAFNAKKVAEMARRKGFKAKDFISVVYPERNGNSSFSDIEANTNPKARAIELMADKLECSIDELFDREHSFSNNTINGDNNNLGIVSVNSNPETMLQVNMQLREIIRRQDVQIEELNRRLDQFFQMAKWSRNESKNNQSELDEISK